MESLVCQGIILFFFVVWSAFGSYYLWKVIDVARRRAASNLWTVTQGKVITAMILPRGRGWHGVDITYTYSVLGTNHERKFTLMETSNKANAETAWEEIGETIAVRYNPNKPQESIPDVEKIKMNDLFLGISLLIPALGILGFWNWAKL